MPALPTGLELAGAVAVPVLAMLVVGTMKPRRRLAMRPAGVLPVLVVLMVMSALDVVGLVGPDADIRPVLWVLGWLTVLAALIRWRQELSEDHVARAEQAQSRAGTDERLERERLAVASAGMGTWEWDVSSNELRWSPGLESRLGLNPGSLGGTLPEHLRAVDPRDRDELLIQLAHAASTGDDVTVRHHVSDENGNAAHLKLVGGAAHDASGQAAWLSGVVLDLDRLDHPEPAEPADPLTGVAPRWQLVSRLQRLLGSADPERLAGLVLVDVRNVSDINDALGHDTGDRFLVAFVSRLVALLREDDLIARIGGCQFAVLPAGIRSREGYTALASSLLSAAEHPLTVSGAELHPVLNLGIALEAPGLSAGEILQRADIAARQARDVPGTYRFYSDADEWDRRTRLELVGALKDSLRRGALQVHYQPQFDLDSGRLVGAEALLRWSRDDGVFVPPSEFLPLAEQAGLMTSITTYVLRSALAQCRDWLRAGQRISVAVNVTPYCLETPTFADWVAEELRSFSVDPSQLILEITETSLASSLLAGSERLTALTRLGVKLSVDDFGTGYSSLAYLKELPVQEIKIDRGFVLGAPSDERDQAVIAAAVTLGHAFGLTVVAEGIETDEAAALVRRLGCDVGQGFGLGRPMPADALGRLLHEDRPAVI